MNKEEESKNEKFYELKLKFHNYKKLKDNSFSLKDSYIYFIEGSNGTGKTTIKDALKSLQIATPIGPQPCTIGEKEGFVEAINLVGADGKRYIIKYTFGYGKSKFIAINEDNKKISSVNEIRNIFRFTNFTADEFMNMSLSAKGREDIKKIFYSILTDESAKEYNLSLIKEKQYYDLRTQANLKVQSLKQSANNNLLTSEERDKLKDSDAIKKDIEEIRTDIKLNDNALNDLSYTESRVKEIERDVEFNKGLIKDLQVKIDMLKAKNLNDEQEKNILLNKHDIDLKDDIEEKIAKLNIILHEKENIAKECIKISVKEENLTNIHIALEDKEREWNDLDLQVKSERQKQDDIIKQSKLPDTKLRLTDKGLMYDNLSFEEGQISKAEAMLIGAEIQCIINKVPLLLIGSAGDLDNENLNKMLELAKRYNKIMIFDKVLKEKSDIAIVGYDVDVLTIKKIK